jgi:Protein of unknown function (DUF3108)
MKTNGTFVIIFALFGALISAPLSNSAQVLPVKPEAVPVYQPKYFPFEGGEKAVYRASWNGMFSVATAEILTTPAVIDGREVYNVRVEAKTSRALDWIWKMRDTILSTFDAKALVPSRFSFHQRENSRVINTEARYIESTKRWMVNRQQVGKRARIWEIDSQNTFDPLTAVYLARSLEFKPGDRLYFKVFGGRNQYLLEMNVERKERVTLSSGKAVEAFRIIPRLQNITKNGYAERMNEAVIWLSADERRIPVKLSSKIAFGRVHLELVEDQYALHAKPKDISQPAS